MTRAGLVLALLLAAALGSGCSCENLRPNTQVMVTIDAEDGVRGMARQLVVRVYGGAGGQSGVPDALVQEFPFPISSSEGWPVTVALAPLDRDPTRRYRVEAVAQTATGGSIATVRAISGYVEGQTLWLRLLLLDGCIGVTCEDPGQTCIGPEMCDDAMIDESDLPPYVDPDAGIAGDGGSGECSASACDDGLACTEDYCDAEGACAHTRRDAMCDDANPCTDDACSGEAGDAPSGCSHLPNADDCDDGIFCNGLDTCSEGVCGHAGDPCGAELTCDEPGDRCLGCVMTSDCPGTMEGAYGPCEYASACDETGTESRTVRTFVCEVGACVPSDTEETRACTRDTDGASCEAEGDGIACTQDVCSSGVCVAVPDDGLCSPSQGCGTAWCDTTSGCREDLSGCAFDAGVDAGHDAGVDAGHDAGHDAGVDAGHDAGHDAGADSGGPVILDGGMTIPPEAGGI